MALQPAWAGEWVSDRPAPRATLPLRPGPARRRAPVQSRHRHASGVLPSPPPGSDQVWPVEPPVVMPVARMLAMSQDNRPFPGSPHLATPLGWRCGLRGASRAHLWSAGRSRTCPVVLSRSWIAASQMMLRSAGHQGSDQLLAAFAALTDRDRSHQNFPLRPYGLPLTLRLSLGARSVQQQPTREEIP